MAKQKNREEELKLALKGRHGTAAYQPSYQIPTTKTYLIKFLNEQQTLPLTDWTGPAHFSIKYI